MQTVIIIDKEPLAPQLLKKTILKLSPYKFSSILTVNSIKGAVDMIRNKKIDLIFLDFETFIEHGCKFPEFLDQIDFKLVFTITNANDIFNAINKWGCFGYLMKPIIETDLQLVLTRYFFQNNKQTLAEDEKNKARFKENSEAEDFKLILNQKNNLLLFSSLNEINFIKISDIIYCKADDNYCEIKTTKYSIIISKPLKDVERIINRSHFVRVNRSYLVNLDYVTRLDKKSNYLEILIETDQTDRILIPITSSGFKILSKATV